MLRFLSEARKKQSWAFFHAQVLRQWGAEPREAGKGSPAPATFRVKARRCDSARSLHQRRRERKSRRLGMEPVGST